MAHFSQCPECGESNHFADSSDYTRKFDCGFSSYFTGVRTDRCERKVLAGKRGGSPDRDSEVEDSRYRLALLDAAHAAESIAADMTQARQDEAFSERCRDLARQMREFAGHRQDSVNFSDLSGKQQPRRGILAIVRRITSR